MADTEKFVIRHSTEEDLPRMLNIYAAARQFMADHGNPDQWGPHKWPPERLIKDDIAANESYVCCNEDGKVVGTFYFDKGVDIEPDYNETENGSWIDGNVPVEYGVVHRIATDGTKGVGSCCINWAFAQCGHIRIDTHEDNTVMQGMLKKNGFARRCTVYVEKERLPRVGFEKKG